MTPEDAGRLIAMLQAAYRTHLSPAELVMHTTAIAELQRAEVAEHAISKLIRAEPRFPPISTIRDAYQHELAYHQDPELEEPELTEEQRQFNIQAACALAERMEAAISQRSAKMFDPPKSELPAHIWTDNPKTWPEPVPVADPELLKAEEARRHA